MVPKFWNRYILGLGFLIRKVDHYVYSKKVGERIVYLVLYVNDMLLVWNDMEVIEEVKLKLSSKFDMKDLNLSNFILGMEVKINHAHMKL